jgi:polysaccharide deacetylase family protein (PEP-CTERM system associated)
VSVAHFFTVDVEEYFQVSAFERYVPRASWPTIASRVHVGVDRLLDLLGRFGYRATFFVLGCVAQRRPEVVKGIAAAGHEIASHGWGHQRITTLTPEEFRDDVRRSKALLEDLAGAPVAGYRAPSYSIVPGREWALDILIEEGYRYDSSLFPVRRRGYGYPGASRSPKWLQRGAGRLYEVPPATVRVAGLTLPAGGGAYFRLFPYGVVRRALRDAAAAGTPGTFYLHPWELDPDQPRLAVDRLTAVRHYSGLRGVEPKLVRLLGEFRFRAVRDGLGDDAGTRVPPSEHVSAGQIP